MNIRSLDSGRFFFDSIRDDFEGKHWKDNRRDFLNIGLKGHRYSEHSPQRYMCESIKDGMGLKESVSLGFEKSLGYIFGVAELLKFEVEGSDDWLSTKDPILFRCMSGAHKTASQLLDDSVEKYKGLAGGVAIGPIPGKEIAEKMILRSIIGRHLLNEAWELYRVKGLYSETSDMPFGMGSHNVKNSLAAGEDMVEFLTGSYDIRLGDVSIHENLLTKSVVGYNGIKFVKVSDVLREFNS